MPKTSELTMKLLKELAQSPRTLRELELVFSMTQRNIRNHIASINDGLSRDDLIIEKNDGRYRLNGGELIEVIFGTSAVESALLALAPSSLKSALADSLLPRTTSLTSLEKNLNKGIDLRYQKKSDDIHFIVTALKANRRISFLYASSGKEQRRMALPIRLYIDPVATYLVAYDYGYSRLITYALPKIHDPVLSTADIPRSNEVQGHRDYLNQAWGKMLRQDLDSIPTARFEVHPSILPYFEQQPLHDSQKVEMKSGSWSIIELKIHNPVEICRYLLRFGRGVKIIGDESVLAEMRCYIDSMKSWYEGDM